MANITPALVRQHCNEVSRNVERITGCFHFFQSVEEAIRDAFLAHTLTEDGYAQAQIQMQQLFQRISIAVPVEDNAALFYGIRRDLRLVLFIVNHRS